MTTSTQTSKPKAPRTVEQVQRDIARLELSLTPSRIAEEEPTKNAIQKRQRRIRDLRKELEALQNVPTSSRTDDPSQDEGDSPPEGDLPSETILDDSEGDKGFPDEEESPEPEPEVIRDPKIPTKEFIDWSTTPYRVHRDNEGPDRRENLVDWWVWDSLCGRYQIEIGQHSFLGNSAGKEIRITCCYRKPNGPGRFRWDWIEKGGQAYAPRLYSSLEDALQAVRVHHERTCGVFPQDNGDEVKISSRGRGIWPLEQSRVKGRATPEPEETEEVTTATDMQITLEQAQALILSVGGDKKLNSGTGEKAVKAAQIHLNGWSRPKVRDRVKDHEIEDEDMAKLRDEVLSHLAGEGKVKVVLHVSEQPEGEEQESDTESSEASNGHTEEETPSPKGKKGKGKKSAAPKGEKTKAPKEPKAKRQPRPSNGEGTPLQPATKSDGPIMGYRPSEFLRWAAREGWTLVEARKVIDHYNCFTTESSFTSRFYEGKRPLTKFNDKYAPMTEKESASLNRIAGRGKKSKTKETVEA